VDRAMGYLTKICDFGPRPSGSEAMVRQQDYLERFFTERGGQVSRQSFEIRHPETGKAVKLTNLIASWGKDRPRRFLLCAHYDTRPFPDRDRVNPRGRFIGANDGASGVAALMEWSHRFGEFPGDLGVDVVLFDGEEFVFQQGRDPYFLGSEYFAGQYVASPPKIRYTGGILLDMVGDRELTLYYERNSLIHAPDMTRSIWRKAKQLGARQFIPRARHEIQDDHLPLNRVAKIPTVDIIDFDYPRPSTRGMSYWHTTKDVPEACSGQSLVTVVWVLDHWIRDARLN
ncbi:MAG: M28 family peptidase, partial [Planctomycetota bacterium]